MSDDELSVIRAWLDDEADLGRLLSRLDPSGRGLQSFLPTRLLRSTQHPYLQQAARVGPTGVTGILRQQMVSDLRSWQSLQACLPSVDGPDESSEPAYDDPFRQTPPWSPQGDRERLLSAFGRTDWSELVDDIGAFLYRHGLGAEQGCVAFRLDGETEASLKPIEQFAAFELDWLVGNEQRLGVLRDNTEHLLDGYRAHNTLIWGPRGCGKSSAIRGLITRHWDQGLRGIEISQTRYHLLPQLFDCVRHRCERFIAVLDNIALDRNDPTVRYLSTVLDGGLETPPDNLVFYATSNFKDLVDREGERPQGPPAMQADAAPTEIRRTDSQSTVRRGFDPQGFQRLDERRALDDRFPLKVFIDMPTKTEYDRLVLDYATRAGIDVPADDLLQQFLVWRTRHNHDLVGGRTARDFILSCYPAANRC